MLAFEPIHPSYFNHDLFNCCIIAFGIIALFQVAGEEESHGLIEPCCEAAFVFPDDIVTIVPGFTVNEFHQHFSLIYG